jgi:hypothetical protein
VCLLTVADTVALAQESPAARGGEIVGRFKVDLQTALRAGLAEGVPEAIAACQVRAPAIAQALSGDGIRVGRTSHRLRNPANAAPAWVEPILAAYLDGSAERVPITLPLTGGRLGYAEPIVMQPLCTACHGESVAPEVAEKLDALYPEDRARGFSVGDLRGVFWVEYPAADQVRAVPK